MGEANRLTPEERKSLTHGEFWIPEKEREAYRHALEALNAAGVPYVVSGLYAIHAYTGVYRKTKDLDLLVVPDRVVEAAEALAGAGFSVHLEEPHWLAQAFLDGAQVDFIFGMSNGIAFIDDVWYHRSRPAILAATPVRIAPPEELIWHRLFIGERHRFDMADVVHLILHLGDTLDWDRLLERVDDSWRLLLSQIHFFDFTYPDYRARIPDSVRERLRELEAGDGSEPGPAPEGAAAPPDDAGEPGAPGDWRGRDTERPLTRGTLMSRYSFAIDVNEWGFHDARLLSVARARRDPVVEEISEAAIWRRGGASG